MRSIWPRSTSTSDEDVATLREKLVKAYARIAELEELHALERN